MKEAILRHKTLAAVLAAILLIAVGIAAGMGIMSKMSAPKDGSYIGTEKAKTIALENVGVSPSKATFTKAEFDREGASAVYEIEFFSGVNEYEFEIDARTGSILEKKSESVSEKPQSSSAQAGAGTQDMTSSKSASAAQDNGSGGSSDFIGIDRAKAIALKHAGVSSSDASFTKAKLDTDDGIRTYEIEFVSGNREYEYEINAYTGELLDVSSEYTDDDSHHSGDHHSGYHE